MKTLDNETKLFGKTGTFGHTSDGVDQALDQLHWPETRSLVDAYYGIPNELLRRRVLKLIQSVGNQSREGSVM